MKQLSNEDTPNNEKKYYYGRMINFNHDEGYGFIKDSSSGEEIYINYFDLKTTHHRRYESLREGEFFKFQIIQGKKGSQAVEAINFPNPRYLFAMLYNNELDKATAVQSLKVLSEKSDVEAEGLLALKYLEKISPKSAGENRLTPEHIFNRFKEKKYDKVTVKAGLRYIIEKNTFESIRISAVNFLGKKRAISRF